jgi:hypothetical protein
MLARPSDGQHWDWAAAGGDLSGDRRHDQGRHRQREGADAGSDRAVSGDVLQVQGEEPDATQQGERGQRDDRRGRAEAPVVQGLGRDQRRGCGALPGGETDQQQRADDQ